MRIGGPPPASGAYRTPPPDQDPMLKKLKAWFAEITLLLDDIAAANPRTNRKELLKQLADLQNRLQDQVLPFMDKYLNSQPNNPNRGAYEALLQDVVNAVTVAPNQLLSEHPSRENIRNFNELVRRGAAAAKDIYELLKSS